MSTTEYSDTLDEFARQESLLSKEPWYHYGLSREDSEKLIRRNGEFLVRNSANTASEFVLTHKWNGRISHLLIKRRVRMMNNRISNSFLYSFGVFEFPFVAELVRYYWVNQLPLTVFSSAVIFRPVHYVSSSRDQGLPWKLGTDQITTNRGDSPTALLPSALSSTRLNRIAGSVADLRGPSINDSTELNLKGSSLLDLRGQTYVDPALLDDMDYCPPELLTGCIQSQSTNRSETSLYDVCSDKRLTRSSYSSASRIPESYKASSQTSLFESAQDKDLSVGPKPRNFTRKGIRYVDMRDAPQLSIANSNDAPSSMVDGCAEVFDLLGMSHNPVNYNLTQAVPSVLLNRIGPVERALDRQAWFELTQMMDKRVFSPLDYASHLTLDLIQLLLPNSVIDQPDRLVKLDAFGATSTKLRRDLFNRARFLRLFVIATILMANKESTRASVLVFWLELAQCLVTIFRDQYTLNSVLRAVFSSKVPKSIWNAATTNSSASVPSVKGSTVEELSACYRALGGRISGERAKQPVIRPEISPYDLRTQIPNLTAFLEGQLNGECNRHSNSSGEQNQQCRVQELWMWDLYCTVKDKNSFLACLSRTETILALLFGPIKLDRGLALDKLYYKLNSVLLTMSKMIEPGTV